MESSAAGHGNAKGMICRGVRVERPVRPERVGTALGLHVSVVSEGEFHIGLRSFWKSTHQTFAAHRQGSCWQRLAQAVRELSVIPMDSPLRRLAAHLVLSRIHCDQEILRCQRANQRALLPRFVRYALSAAIALILAFPLILIGPSLTEDSR